MNICKDCLRAATVWRHDGYTSGCEGCNTRGIAITDRVIRDRWCQMTEEKEGKEAGDAMRKRISDELGRILRVKKRNWSE